MRGCFKRFNRLTANTDNSASYVKSNSVEEFPYKGCLASAYRTAIVESKRDTNAHRQQLAQSLVDYLSSKLGIVSVPVIVKECARPHRTNERGSLKSSTLGCYHYSLGSHTPVDITIWNLTAVKKNKVSNKQFLGTLLHEYCHHIDYQVLHLDKSLHTAGFYKRISSLDRMLSAA